MGRVRLAHPDCRFAHARALMNGRSTDDRRSGHSSSMLFMTWYNNRPIAVSYQYYRESDWIYFSTENTATVVHTTLTAHIADSSPALERPSSTSSIYTALKQAISSFSLHLMLVTNGSRASSHLPSTASFPEALILGLYGHKNFTIVINSPLRCRIGYSMCYY